MEMPLSKMATGPPMPTVADGPRTAGCDEDDDDVGGVGSPEGTNLFGPEEGEMEVRREGGGGGGTTSVLSDSLDTLALADLFEPGVSTWLDGEVSEGAAGGGACPTTTNWLLEDVSVLTILAESPDPGRGTAALSAVVVWPMASATGASEVVGAADESSSFRLSKCATAIAMVSNPAILYANQDVQNRATAMVLSSRITQQQDVYAHTTAGTSCVDTNC
jgi:hypothetical protein